MCPGVSQIQVGRIQEIDNNFTRRPISLLAARCAQRSSHNNGRNCATCSYAIKTAKTGGPHVQIAEIAELKEPHDITGLNQSSWAAADAPAGLVTLQCSKELPRSKRARPLLHTVSRHDNRCELVCIIPLEEVWL